MYFNDTVGIRIYHRSNCKVQKKEGFELKIPQLKMGELLKESAAQSIHELTRKEEK